MLGWCVELHEKAWCSERERERERERASVLETVEEMLFKLEEDLGTPLRRPRIGWCLSWGRRNELGRTGAANCVR